jgi:hypothetical protein
MATKGYDMVGMGNYSVGYLDLETSTRMAGQGPFGGQVEDPDTSGTYPQWFGYNLVRYIEDDGGTGGGEDS